MQILPDTLNLVVLGAVRRQRMQLNPATGTAQRSAHRVNALLWML
jgi:hypothetical protein